MHKEHGSVKDAMLLYLTMGFTGQGHTRGKAGVGLTPAPGLAGES